MLRVQCSGCRELGAVIPWRGAANDYIFKKVSLFLKSAPLQSHMPITALNGSKTQNDSRIKNTAIGNH